MPLILLIVAALVLGLGLVQAWTIWFLRREIQRLELRLNEALDDEDLLEFQERLKSLLEQARETAAGLAQSADDRRKSLEKSLEKANLAEKSLALRILAKSALEKPARPPSAKAAAPREGRAKDKAKAGSGPARPAGKAAPPSGRSADAPAAPKAALPAPARRAKDFESGDDAFAGDGKSENGRRNYLVRPAAAPARYQNIYDLADQGLSPEQIAKDSGLLAGEVALILNLRRKDPPRA